MPANDASSVTCISDTAHAAEHVAACVHAAQLGLQHGTTTSADAEPSSTSCSQPNDSEHRLASVPAADIAFQCPRQCRSNAHAMEFVSRNCACRNVATTNAAPACNSSSKSIHCKHLQRALDARFSAANECGGRLCPHQRPHLRNPPRRARPEHVWTTIHSTAASACFQPAANLL